MIFLFHMVAWWALQAARWWWILLQPVGSSWCPTAWILSPGYSAWLCGARKDQNYYFAERCKNCLWDIPGTSFFFFSAWELGKLYVGGCFTISWHIDTNLFDHIYFTQTYWVYFHCWGIEATWEGFRFRGAFALLNLEYVVSFLNWLRHRLTGLFMWILAGFSLCWVYYAPFSLKKMNSVH